MKYFCIFALLLAGCAPAYTSEQYLDITTKHYDGVTEKQTIDAAKKVLLLADKEDTLIMPVADNEIKAQRKWSYYAVLAAGMGTDYWNIKALKKGDGVNMSVSVQTASSGVAPMQTMNGDVSAMASPYQANFAGEAIYRLFWLRMDYLLGKSDNWVSCSDFKRIKSDNDYWGNIDPLCMALTTDDEKPI